MDNENWLIPVQPSLSVSTLLVSLCYVTASITHLVSVEVGWWSGMLWSGLLATSWGRALIAVLHIEVVIYIAMEVGGAMEPLAGTYEDSAVEPLRAVVAVGSAVVGGVVVVAIGTIRRRSDLDSDLGVGFRGCCDEGDAGARYLDTRMFHLSNLEVGGEGESCRSLLLWVDCSCQDA
jgi:hypothetical protein